MKKLILIKIRSETSVRAIFYYNIFLKKIKKLKNRTSYDTKLLQDCKRLIISCLYMSKIY